jgi:Tol biopolymer transport system component
MKHTIAVVILGAALLMGCTTPAEFPVLETGEPALNSGSIAFLGLDGNLYTMLEGESTVRQITTDASADSLDLRYSGYAWIDEKIVYVAQLDPGRENARSRILIATPGDGSRELLTRDGIAPFFLLPSPDGQRVGYLGSQRGEGGYVMASVDIESGDTIVHGKGQPFYSAWSPDGSDLLTHVGRPTGQATGSSLTLRDSTLDGFEGGSRLDLITGRFQSPAYAPNGDSIAVVLTDREGRAGIHLLSAEGEDAGRIATTRGSTALGWAPNGSQIAFIDGVLPAGTALGGPLAVVGGSRREPRVISRFAIAFFWSPDSTKLLYLEPFAVEGSSQIGYRVGLFRTFGGDSQIIATIRPAPEFAQQIIPFFDQYNRAYSIWSPDSRNIVLNTLADTGERVIILMDTEVDFSDDTFRVSYTPVQDLDERSANLGILTPEGAVYRPLFYGTVPFFSRIERSVGEAL